MTEPTNEFHTLDYVVFGAMLMLSTGIGVYFGYFNKPKKSDDEEEDEYDQEKKAADFGSKSMMEYLLGSRKLKAFPVAMSLVASYISGVTVLGTPSEIYLYGTQYYLMILPIFLMGFVVSYVYLPVFCSLQVGSSYEYLELRFNGHVRTIASVMFVIDEFLFLPIVIYVPSLAMNAVSHADLHTVGAIVTIVCVFYTLVGGIKAVVHTDAWQIVILFISVLVVTFIGTFRIDGGLSEVFRIAKEGDRLQLFNFDPSLYERQTFWCVLIGGFFYWTSFNSVNQTMVQRYMSLPSITKARRAIVMFSIGIILFITACCYSGLLIYARYSKCDPITSGLCDREDQMFAMYVLDTVGKWPGVAGLFIAGVFGAALSSLSVVLNSTAAVLLEDIVKGALKLQLSERSAFIFVKVSILVLGAIAMGCLFVVDKMGGILGVTTSLTAIAAGTTFGVFSLGMLNPYANSNGAMVGAIAGALLSGWVSIGSQVAVALDQVVPHTLPVSVEACPIRNITGIVPKIYPDESDVFPLYRLSFHWINPIGLFTVLIVGSVVSYLTGCNDLASVDPELISPVIHRFLPSDAFANFGMSSKSKRLRDNHELKINGLYRDSDAMKIDS